MLTPDFSTQIKPQICHSQLTVDNYDDDGREDSLSRPFSHYLQAIQKVAVLTVSGSTLLGGQVYSWA